MDDPGFADTQWLPREGDEPSPAAPRPAIAFAHARASAPARRAPASADASSWPLRHWRGGLSLPVSFWAVGVLLVGTLQALLLQLASSEPVSEHLGLRGGAALALAMMAAALALNLWSWTGIVRSALRHPGRGGSLGWSVMACVMVVLWVLGMLGESVGTHAGARVAELARLAAGRDDLAAVEVMASPDGRSLMLRGDLGLGSHERAIAAMAKLPALRTVVLRSRGGRLYEAREIARVVRARHLDTDVEEYCASACTMVFLAGAERIATPNARIGFHRPHFAGLDVLNSPEVRAMMDDYRAAGLSDNFVEHIRATPAQGIWIPSHDELVKERVVTRTWLGREDVLGAGLDATDDAQLRTRLTADRDVVLLESRFPGSLDEMVARVHAVLRDGGTPPAAMAAARQVFGEKVPKALGTSSDEVLADYGRVVRDEMAAARALGDDACSGLLAGTLNVQATLPEEVVRRDAAVTRRVLGEVPALVTLPPKPMMEASVRRAVRAMPAQQADALTEPGKSRAKPLQRCEAVESLLEAALHLPPADRGLALRGILVR